MSESIANARKFLESLQRFDLSKLLSHSEIAEDWFGSGIVICAPPPIDEALSSLSPQDRKRIAEAVLSDKPNQSVSDDIRVERDTKRSIEGPGSLLAELIIHRQMMIAVSTGGPSIQDVNDYYIARQNRLGKFCSDLGIQYQNPHGDLWDWYEYWKLHFSTYAERRRYVASLFKNAVNVAALRSALPIIEREPTGWERVDRALAKARAQAETASAEEDFQAIGLLCREVIISLAQAVYDPAVHDAVDGVTPSLTDANRMLEAFVAHVFAGESYKEVRAHARASLSLALNLQHRRTATKQLAALCVEAAASTSAVIAIIAERDHLY